MGLYNNLIYLILISIFNKFAISLKDEDFGTSTLCMGNSTSPIPSFYDYDNNVSPLLSELALKSDDQQEPGFYATSVGSARSRKVFGSYMCWGDINPKLCRRCVNQAIWALSNQVYYHECFGFGDYLDSNLCLIHYSNNSVTEYKSDFVMNMGSVGKKVANYLPYNRTLSTTIEGLIKEAAVGNWSRTNMETRVVPVSGTDQKIHILMQCIPVISAKNCSRCLLELYDYVPRVCNGTQGGIVGHTDCILKFNNQSFIGGSYITSSPNYLYVRSILLSFLFFVICI